MIREVDLVSYLPPFLAGYRELREALAAENPEFALAWDAADRALRNEFIDTADEYGIARFEGMLGILSSRGDALEDRRARVRSRGFTAVPYTYRMLVEMVARILGDAHDFYIWSDFKTDYGMILTVCTMDDSQDMELKRTLDRVIPANIPVSIIYESPLEGDMYFGGMMCEADILEMKERGTGE